MTATQISDVPGKRALEKDSLVPEEEAAFKKPKVGEEEDENMEDESESESESENEEEYEAEAKAKAESEGRGGVGKKVWSIYDSQSEPEWDVDSFDGCEYESDPEIRGKFTTDEDYEQFRNHKIQAFNNRGFYPDPFKGIGPILGMEELSFFNMTNREYLEKIASLCVKELNEKKNKTVEFVSIVRANMGGAGNWKLYITFMAREYPNGPHVEYQAKAMDFAGEARPPFPIFCRPVPEPAPKPLV